MDVAGGVRLDVVKERASPAASPGAQGIEDGRLAGPQSESAPRIPTLDPWVGCVLGTRSAVKASWTLRWLGLVDAAAFPLCLLM